MQEVADSLMNGQYKQAMAQILEYDYELKEVYTYLSAEGFDTFDVAILADMIIREVRK